MNAQTVTESRNWMSYLMDSLVNSGAMPTWEAVEYLTNNLVGEAPNATLHHSKSPYETIQQFLHRIYGPIVEAASRTVELPPQAMIHMFTDISLMGKSAVLVVYFPGHNQPHQLLLLDSIPAWDLMFTTPTAFIMNGPKSGLAGSRQPFTPCATKLNRFLLNMPEIFIQFW